MSNKIISLCMNHAYCFQEVDIWIHSTVVLPMSCISERMVLSPC